jgi:hypothetical protein
MAEGSFPTENTPIQNTGGMRWRLLGSGLMREFPLVNNGMGN